MIDGKQIKSATITQSKLSLVAPASANDAATKTYVDTLVQNSVYGQDWKASVRAASTANVNIASAPSAIDGVNLNANDRVLLKNQTTASQNGIYVFTAAGSALTRSADANNSASVTPELAVSVEEGTANATTSWKLVTTGVITVDTTALTFQLFAVFTAPTLTNSNKNMAASVTANDGDLACATSIAGTPANSSSVQVSVNGVIVNVGNGVKTTDCYFSGDAGATARASNAVLAGDKLYWVGSVAGYQLAATDLVTFTYQV